MESVEVVFIGALPFKTNESFIRKLVEPFGLEGPVEIHADWENPTGEPYALVRLRKADAAVETLDGHKVGTYYLRVHKKGQHGLGR